MLKRIRSNSLGVSQAMTICSYTTCQKHWCYLRLAWSEMFIPQLKSLNCCLVLLEGLIWTIFATQSQSFLVKEITQKIIILINNLEEELGKERETRNGKRPCWLDGGKSENRCFEVMLKGHLKILKNVSSPHQYYKKRRSI